MASDLAGLAAREDFASRIEPAPRSNDQPACWDLVIADVLYLFAVSDPIRDIMIRDMRERDRFGAEKYKTRLQPFNGRKPIVDAYQEALDLCVYLRQALFEKDTPERNRAYRYALDVASILRREIDVESRL